MGCDEPGASHAIDSSPWRLATDEDFDRIVEMNERLNSEDPSETTRFDRAMMRRTLREIEVNPIRGAAAVLELGHQRCGYALLISFWSNEFGGEICAIDELYVEPEFRGRGFATLLIQSLAKGASPIWPRQTTMITVEAYRTNPRAKAFYERLGFEASPNHSLILARGHRVDRS
jgi:ribosomal protein S18 acetylase RimI-like enzyme